MGEVTCSMNLSKSPSVFVFDFELWNLDERIHLRGTM